MNNQARRRIKVTHYLFQSNQHLENFDDTAYDDTEHFYDVNTSIATVRCFWQHIVSSTVGANLMNIRVYYSESVDDEDTVEIVEDRHRDGTPVTIGYLAGLDVFNSYDTPYFRLFLLFDYIMGEVVNEPHCICNS